MLNFYAPYLISYTIYLNDTAVTELERLVIEQRLNYSD